MFTRNQQLGMNAVMFAALVLGLHSVYSSQLVGLPAYTAALMTCLLARVLIPRSQWLLTVHVIVGIFLVGFISALVETFV